MADEDLVKMGIKSNFTVKEIALGLENFNGISMFLMQLFHQ